MAFAPVGVSTAVRAKNVRWRCRRLPSWRDGDAVDGGITRD